MAFANIAGRAGFILELDKRDLDRGLKDADRDFDRATSSMAVSADRAGRSIGDTRGGRGGIGLVGKIGLIGLAAGTGLQALGSLSDGLRVTGSEAGTTEGRFRNFAASLTQGDLIGGLKALYTEASFSAEQLGELQQQALAAGSQVELTALQANLAASGLGKMADQLGEVSRAISEQVAQEAVLFAQRKANVGQIGGVAIGVPRGTIPNDRGGAQGVGAIGLPPGLRTTREFGDAAAVQAADDAALQARLSEGLSDDLDAAQQIERLAKARVAAARKGTDDYRKQLEALVQARDQRRAVESRIAAAEQAKQAEADRVAAERARAAEQQARERQAALEQAERAAEEAREDRQRRLEAQTDRINAFAGKNVDRLNRAFREAKSGRELLAEARSQSTPTEGGLTVADIRRLQVEFLTGLQGMTNQFGSNVTADGAQTAVNTWQSARLTEKLVGSVDRLTRGVQHPGAKYARLELMLPFGGVGSV